MCESVFDLHGLYCTGGQLRCRRNEKTKSLIVTDMNRREVIKRTAILMGGVVSAPAIMGILKGCKAKPGVAWTPKYFTQEQAYVITEVAEIIIPKTDTAGAKDAGVPAFIEQMIFEAYSEEDRTKFMAALEN